MIEATRLDRLIAYFAPERGARRLMARAAVSLQYEAAKRGRRSDGWISTSTSADAEISLAMADLRDRARSVVRDNPHAAKGLQVKVTNEIGTGILATAYDAPTPEKPRPNQRKNQKVNDLWKFFVDNCDLTGSTDYYGIQALVARTRNESGEALVRRVNVATRSRFDTGFRLQVLEPDFLDTSRNERISDTHFIRHGVEYSSYRPVAYWLFDEHPGDNNAYNLRRNFLSRRVGAESIRHVFKPLRAGQTRGVTEFAQVILRLRELDDYDDAERLRKRIAACLAFFVQTPAGLPAASIGALTVDPKDGKKVEQIRPGQIVYGKPGETFTAADPKPSDDYEAFTKVQLRAVAAGLGVPYELLTQDISEANYSSMRGQLVQFKAACEADQWQVYIPQFCNPVWLWFLAEANRMDATISIDIPAKYTPPRFELLDPSKEVDPAIAEVKSGLRSYQDAIRRSGMDPAEVLDEIEEFQTELDEREIILTSDARYEIKLLEAKAKATPPPNAAAPAREAA